MQMIFSTINIILGFPFNQSPFVKKKNSSHIYTILSLHFDNLVFLFGMLQSILHIYLSTYLVNDSQTTCVEVLQKKFKVFLIMVCKVPYIL